MYEVALKDILLLYIFWLYIQIHTIMFCNRSRWFYITESVTMTMTPRRPSYANLLFPLYENKSVV